MVTKELSEAAVEFNCIMENSSQEVINKIPKKFIDFIKSIASKTYTFNYDISKSLDEQELKDETRGLIALVYQDYICNDEQKKEYILKCKKYEEEKERYLRDKYNPDNLFKNKNVTKIIDNEIQQKSTFMVEYKEKNFIQRLLDKIKCLFKK